VTPLWLASWANQEHPERSAAIVSELLHAGASVRQGPDGTWPHHRAAMSACVPMLEALLAAGADVNQLTGSPPDSTSGAGSTPLLCMMTRSNDVRAWDRQAKGEAKTEDRANDWGGGDDTTSAWHTPPEMFEAVTSTLLAARADVDARSRVSGGESVLTLATHNANLLKMVLQAGPDAAHLVCSPCAICDVGCATCTQVLVATHVGPRPSM
jgi:ankyrin repeat protein